MIIMDDDFTTRLLKNEDYLIWDEIVETSSQGNIFNTSDWLRAISLDLSGFELYGIFKKEVLIGGCCIFLQKKTIFKYAYSPLFATATPYGGIVLRAEKTKVTTEIESLRRSAIKSLLGYFNSKSFDRITLVNSPNFMDVRPFTWAGWKPDIKYTYLLNLDNTLWDRISSRCRQTIRKALKNSIDIKCSSDIDEFYKLYELTYSSQNLPTPESKNLIKEIFDKFSKKEQCKLWTAKTDTGKLAAAAIFVWDSKRAYGWVGASNPNLRENGAPSLLYWSIFEELSKKFGELDLCGANTPNIVKFKTSFNPELVSYYKIDYTSPKLNLFLNMKNLLRR
jgi:hypothetical protein